MKVNLNTNKTKVVLELTPETEDEKSLMIVWGDLFKEVTPSVDFHRVLLVFIGMFGVEKEENDNS